MQVFLNMFAFGMGPQEALDAPRISVCCCSPSPTSPPPLPRADAAQIGRNYDPRAAGVALESGIADDVVEALRGRGHDVRVVEEYDRVMFGRGQVIRVGLSLPVRRGRADGRRRLAMRRAGSGCILRAAICGGTARRWGTSE